MPPDSESPLVLLTGATGFVGRQVLRALTERNARVRPVVRAGREASLSRHPLVESAVTSPDIFTEGEAWWRNAVRGADIVIHAAWYAEPGKYLTSRHNDDCLQGTLRLGAAVADEGVKRFAGIGTCFEYDLSAGDLSIATPLKPATPYAEAKVAAFQALSKMLPARGMSFAWCRLFYLHGDGEDARRFVPYLRAKLAAGEPADLTSGDQVRDYLDVRAAGEMIADVALGDAEGAVNICSGVPVTIRALAERIADEYGRRDLLRFGARPDNLTDPPRVVGVR